jgi:ABC-type amino acid transport substrate-binding protein
MEVLIKRGLALLLTLALMAGTAAPAFAETTLEKISRTGVLTIGTRTGSPPFAYIDKNNEWVGFTIDLVEQGVLPAVVKKVGKPVKLEKKESTPPTRIPLLTSNAVDLIAGTMTDTPQRRESVDFSLTFFLTGAQFMVKKGSPIRGIEDIAGKRVAAQQGSTNAKIIRERVPTAILREFPDQPAAFQALVQGQVDTYQRRHPALRPPSQGAGPRRVGVVAPSAPPSYGMARARAIRLKETRRRLRNLVESGKYFELYNKWFGPKSEVPYPMTEEVKASLLSQLKK